MPGFVCIIYFIYNYSDVRKGGGWANKTTHKVFQTFSHMKTTFFLSDDFPQNLLNLYTIEQ